MKSAGKLGVVLNGAEVAAIASTAAKFGCEIVDADVVNPVVSPLTLEKLKSEVVVVLGITANGAGVGAGITNPAIKNPPPLPQPPVPRIFSATLGSQTLIIVAP